VKSKYGNVAELWADLLVESLVRQGMRRVCLSPGSRSTLLALAVASHPKLETTVHFDERSLGFFALGVAKGGSEPVGVLTTSGTAVANLLPSVVEAHYSSTPLVLLTADRPPELRDVGANQSIKQPNIFGEFVKWSFDMPCPTVEIDPAFVVSTASEAFRQASDPSQGPVHLNCMFREPFVSDSDPIDFGSYLAPIETWLAQTVPFRKTYVGRGLSSDSRQKFETEFSFGDGRTLMIVGGLKTRREAEAVYRFALERRLPVVADVTSQLRMSGGKSVIPVSSALLSLLEDPDHRPESLLVVGGRLTSKQLIAYIKNFEGPSLVVTGEAERIDPEHMGGPILEVELGAFFEAGGPKLSPSKDDPWLARMNDFKTMYIERCQEVVAETAALSEPLVAQTVGKVMQQAHVLFLSNSMPIRAFDMYGSPGTPHVGVYANRGASGIDGIVSTAIGVGVGQRKPVVLVIGDLALLHDLGALHLIKAAGVRVTLVVINNDGGGIFSFLPISEQSEHFQTYFQTPHGVGFEGVAKTFDLAYQKVEDAGGLESTLSKAVDHPDSCLVEVIINQSFNKDVFETLQGALKHQTIVVQK